MSSRHHRFPTGELDLARTVYRKFHMEPHPKVREFAGWTLGKSIGDELLKLIVEAGPDLFPSCITCKNWNEGMNGCNLYQATPPARIIARGCQAYKDVQDIPF